MSHPRLLDYVLSATRDDYAAGLWVGEKYAIKELWARYGDGAGARVAVLDTGCNSAHSQLAGRVTARHDFTPDTSGVEDSDGHGTHVCGIVAAAPAGGHPIGVAPGCEVHSFRVFGEGGACSNARINAALQSIADGKHGFFDVINMSLGSDTPDERQRMLLMRLSAMGTLVVCAAGNSFDHLSEGAPRFGTVSYPASFHSTIAVGSTNSLESRSRYSSTGPKLALVAPGEGVVSTWLDGRYAELSGTSMAAPFVSGVLAVLCAWCRRTDRGVSLDRLMYSIAASCFDTEDPGFDMTTGYGVIRPLALMERYAELPHGPPT